MSATNDFIIKNKLRLIEARKKEYEAVTNELCHQTDPTARVRLKHQLKSLEEEISALETEINPLVAQNSSANPFFVGGRINDPMHFFGRIRLLREIENELKKRSSISLVGPSETGKSSLLYHLKQTQSDWFPEARVAYINLELVWDDKDFFETTLTELGEKGNTYRELKLVFRNTNQVFILLFDEVKLLTESEFNPRLHRFLRGLAQEPHISICLATLHPLREVFPPQPGMSPLENAFLLKTIGPFTEAEARKFLAQRLAQTTIHFSEEEITQLIAESEGYPARLQRRAKLLYDQKISS